MSERDVERALVDNLAEVLVELGTGFAYMGRQFRLVIGGDEFFLDLLFYHVRLRRYVVFELKVGKFLAEHTGKLSLYLSAVDELISDPTVDGSAIGDSPGHGAQRPRRRVRPAWHRPADGCQPVHVPRAAA